MIYYIIMFIATVLITWLVRVLALRANVIDNPNERSSHTVPTPRGGSLAFVAE